MLWMAFWVKSGRWSGTQYEFLGSSDLGWICGIRINHEWDFWSDKSYRLWCSWRRAKGSPRLLYQKGWRKLKMFCGDNFGASLRYSCGDPGLGLKAHTQVCYTTLLPSAKKLTITLQQRNLLFSIPPGPPGLIRQPARAISIWSALIIHNTTQGLYLCFVNRPKYGKQSFLKGKVGGWGCSIPFSLSQLSWKAKRILSLHPQENTNSTHFKQAASI